MIFHYYTFNKFLTIVVYKCMKCISIYKCITYNLIRLFKLIIENDSIFNF